MTANSDKLNAIVGSFPDLPDCRPTRKEDSMCEEADSSYKWEIEPHPYTDDFDVYVTDSDEEARQAILHAAEMYLWDSNDGDDDGPHGKSRVLKVTHNADAGAHRAAVADTATPLGGAK